MLPLPHVAPPVPPLPPVLPAALDPADAAVLDPADGAGVLPLLLHAAKRIDAAATSAPIRASLVFKMLLLHIRPVDAPTVLRLVRQQARRTG